MTIELDERTPAIDDPMSLPLSEHDRHAVLDLAADLAADPAGRIDAPEWTDRAREESNHLPPALRAAVRAFRRDPGRAGVLLVRGLPVDEANLPPTPTAGESVQEEPTVPAAALVLTSSQLGEVVAFRQEKGGALVQDVVPVPGREEFQGNAGSVTLKMHTENAFHPNTPDFVVLLCLRNDHDNVAGLLTSSMRAALGRLSAETRTVLREPRFVTTPPPSFGTATASPGPRPVLTGAEDDPDVRVDFAATTPLEATAADALDRLREALDGVSVTTVLRPGDLAVVDNRIALHGRTSFRPRYDGRDRWLQRTYVQLDPRRSRSSRLGDGNILF